MTAVMEPPTARLNPETPDTVTDLVELYRGRRQQLVGYASKFAGGRDQAEDAVQEAFVKLLTNPEQVRNAAAFVTAQARYRGQDESVHRGRQVPAGDAVDWQPDTAPPAEDLDTLPACMGDPAVVKAVDAALAKLPERQARAIRMRLLEGKKVSEIAPVLGVDKTTVYTDLSIGLETLRRMDVPIPGEEGDEPEPATGKATMAQLVATLDAEHPGEWINSAKAEETLRHVYGVCSAARAARAQQVHNAPLTAPMRVRAGSGPAARAAADAELVVTLGREFPGRTVTIDEAEKTLRHIHGSCSLGRARQARTQHNAKVAEPAKPKAVKAPARTPAKKVTPEESPAVRSDVKDDITTSAQGAPTVAEVWLLGARPPISCLLVHTDETTGSRDLAAVSMGGAQREITGQLIGEGYRPDGPWLDIDPAAPEAMRKWLPGGAA